MSPGAPNGKDLIQQHELQQQALRMLHFLSRGDIGDQSHPLAHAPIGVQHGPDLFGDPSPRAVGITSSYP